MMTPTSSTSLFCCQRLVYFALCMTAGWGFHKPLLSWSSNSRLNHHDRRNNSKIPSSFLRWKTTSTTALAGFGRPPQIPLINPLNLSGPVVAQFAEVAIKLRLADCTSVQCEVSEEAMSASSATTDLILRGKIGPFSLKGKNWQTKRGLTCRAIEVSLQSLELDLKAMVQRQNFVIQSHGQGKAMIALDAHDFGNFITHPRTQPPPSIRIGQQQQQQQQSERPQILTRGISIDGVQGTVAFAVEFAGQAWQCTLERCSNQEGTVQVSVDTKTSSSPSLEDNGNVPHDHDDDNDNNMLATELSTSLTQFFNNLCYQVDGTRLSYQDMMVTDKGAAPSVMLALSILPRSN